MCCAPCDPWDMLDLSGEERPMATNGPDPAEFLERAQRMLRELFGDLKSSDDPWGR